MMDDLQEQLINDLLLESFEGLDRFDRDLLVLESGGGNAEVLNRVFRVIHTIKGTAGCLGFQKIEKVAHVGESLLSLLRENRLAVTSEITSTLLTYADGLREMLRSLETTRTEGDRDYSELLGRLVALQNPSSASAAPVESANPADNEASAGNGNVWGLFEEPEATPATPTPAVAVTGDGWGLFPEDSLPSVVQAPTLPTTSGPIQMPVPAAGAAEHEAATRSSIAESAIRVDVGLLDRLMNLVGELVLARNQINQHLATSRDGSLVAMSQRLNLITTELQEGVMKTRMQPIDNVLNRFPRIVRDVAHELGKQVRLEIAGRETELDRTIIESIKDPLTHVVRNSIDHGIENPQRRREQGKSETGLLFIRAYHEGGQVNIEVADDGAGINAERVKQKALDKGLITAEHAARLTDREAANLIFLPGLSTAEQVTNVSGRGVGMDVVKTNIERIGGSVEILSDPGQGTTIKFKIPLTLAIIPALIVTSGGERFAIPQVSLLELVRIESDGKGGGIEQVFNASVYRLRGKLLPVAYLSEVLGLDSPVSSAAGANLIVVQADGRQFGLVVDAVNDTEEIVVKPLGKQLKGIGCFAGATIMGDGRVALILDVLGLAQRSAVFATSQNPATTKDVRQDLSEHNRRQALLLFDAGQNSRLAMPLSQASRLEEFSLPQIECCGTRPVVQYRGAILPLIDIARQLQRGGMDSSRREACQVVVFTEQGRSVGLVVDRIVDIVEEEVAVQRHGAAEGILGSALVRGKVTDLLDVRAVIQKADPAFFAGAA